MDHQVPKAVSAPKPSKKQIDRPSSKPTLKPSQQQASPNPVLRQLHAHSSHQTLMTTTAPHSAITAPSSNSKQYEGQYRGRLEGLQGTQQLRKSLQGVLGGSHAKLTLGGHTQVQSTGQPVSPNHAHGSMKKKIKLAGSKVLLPGGQMLGGDPARLLHKRNSSKSQQVLDEREPKESQIETGLPTTHPITDHDLEQYQYQSASLHKIVTTPMSFHSVESRHIQSSLGIVAGHSFQQPQDKLLSLNQSQRVSQHHKRSSSKTQQPQSDQAHIQEAASQQEELRAESAKIIAQVTAATTKPLASASKHLKSKTLTQLNSEAQSKADSAARPNHFERKRGSVAHMATETAAPLDSLTATADHMQLLSHGSFASVQHPMTTKMAQSKRLSMPKAVSGVASGVNATPNFKTEKQFGTSLGGKRMSVATIPARKNNVSPIRSSFDNLASVFSKGKQSMVLQSPAAGALTGLSAKTQPHFSSKKNSMPKLLVSSTNFNTNADPASQVQVYFVDAAQQAQHQASESRPKGQQQSRKGSATRVNSNYLVGSGGLTLNTAATAENLHHMHEKLASLKNLSSKARKAERGAHYAEKSKKSKKAQLHESGQFSPTTSKMIKHFLSKQKASQALIATLNGEKKSIPRKQTFLQQPRESLASSTQQAAAVAGLGSKQRRSSFLGATLASKNHSQRSLKQSVTRLPAKGSTSAVKSKNDKHLKDMFKTLVPQQSTSSTLVQVGATAPYTATSTAKKPKRQGSVSKQRTPYKSSAQIAHSGSSKKLLQEKVKPPLQKNNFVTGGTGQSTHANASPRLSIKQEKRLKKRDRESSQDNNQQALCEKKMAFSQSVQQLTRSSAHSSQQPSNQNHQQSASHQREPRLTIKKIKKEGSYQTRTDLMKSIEKLQLQQARQRLVEVPNQVTSGPLKSSQVSAAQSEQSSSVVQTIVSINKHPYFVGETFSDQNATDQKSYQQQDVLLNSDTNALALTSDQTRTKRRSKQASTKDGSRQSSTFKKRPDPTAPPMHKDSTISVASHRDADSTDQQSKQFEPYGHQPVSPIQQSLFDNLNSLTNNQTNLFSGRSSGERLRTLVLKMSTDQQRPHQQEAIDQLESMHQIIQQQEQLIKQFQKDVQRQEDVIQRYEKHIQNLEGGRSSHTGDPRAFGDGSETTSLQNPPSSHQALALQRHETDRGVAPQKQNFSPSETEEDGTVKYNLTENSILKQGKRREGVVSRSEVLHMNDAEPDQANEASLKKASRRSQSEQVLTERKLRILEEKEHMRLKLRKKEKTEKFQKQKINKLMFFFFTLQNKGVPVNEIYEQEGIKAICTDRFDEIMAQIAKDNAGESAQPEPPKQDQASEDAFSFYTEDSYEYLQPNPDITMKPYERPESVPALNFEELPDYVTSSEEGDEEEVDEPNPKEQASQDAKQECDGQNFSSQLDIQQQRESMSNKDYRNSLSYINKFYQKHYDSQEHEPASDEKAPNSKGVDLGHEVVIGDTDGSPFQTPIDQSADEEATVLALGKKQPKTQQRKGGEGKHAAISPQQFSDLDGDADFSDRDHLIEYQPCVTENKLECLEISDHEAGVLSGFKPDHKDSPLKDQMSERNLGSVPFQLLSPPSKKTLQNSHSMVQGRPDHAQSSHPYLQHQSQARAVQARSNQSNSKNNDRHYVHSVNSQSQSALESIDMILSHDQQTSTNLKADFGNAPGLH